MHVHRHRRAVALVLGTGLGVSALVGVASQGPASAATTIKVGNPATCGSTDFNTIQAAVNAATTGDTIQVCAGNYGEKVTIDTPGLTLLGAADGKDPRASVPRPQSIVHNVTGVFSLTANADDTTISGFTISDASSGNSTGVVAIAGSSGLTLTDNIIQNNGNGVFLQNPDGDDPTVISHNRIANNSANYASSQGQTGSGVFICCGPGNGVQIVDNAFSRHTETAINTAGDASNPSEGIVIAGNTSINDATFAVVTNTANAIVETNRVSTNPTGVPSGVTGTAILDFGANSGLRIVSNTLSQNATSDSSAINLRDFTPNGQAPSTGTTVVGNTVAGWLNGVRVDDGSRASYVANNRLRNSQNDGILVGDSIKRVTFARNVITGAGTHSCEDKSTGRLTAGTANTWRRNTGDTASTPVGICS